MFFESGRTGHRDERTILVWQRERSGTSVSGTGARCDALKRSTQVKKYPSRNLLCK